MLPTAAMMVTVQISGNWFTLLTPFEGRGLGGEGTTLVKKNYNQGSEFMPTISTKDGTQIFYKDEPLPKPIRPSPWREGLIPKQISERS